MYHVKNWDTDEIIASFDNLKDAKRVARAQGHTGETVPESKWIPPVAYVADDNGYCVYNPRFKKEG